MDEIFEGIPVVTPLMDDIIVSGTAWEDHDANHKTTLQMAAAKSLKLKSEKLTIGTEEVEYFGHLVIADGLKHDPAKVKAIHDMPPPCDRKELQALLGMITYLAKFASQQSETTKPMRDLLKEDAESIWDEQQQTALQKIKDTIKSQPVLAFFDPKKEVRLEVDANKFGLGAAIFQEDKPVAYASKSMTPAEQNYTQIEKELYTRLPQIPPVHLWLGDHHTL